MFDERFSNYDLLDPDKTSAYIDTTNNFARLPEQSLPSAITVLKDSPGFAVATKNGIKLYEYDDSTDTMQLNNIFSCPLATDATGVAIRRDNLNIWGISHDSVAYYKYNGSGMSNDPNLKVTGLNNIISVAGFQNRDSAIVLKQTVDKKAEIYRYDAGSTLTVSAEITTDITDPVAVSMVNDSPDFRLFTKNAVYYFAYDDAAGNYIEDPGRKISSLANVVSGSSDDTGNTILTVNRLDYYMNLDGGGAAQVNSFSPGAISGGVSAALRPGTFDQIILTKDGQVQWWTYDDNANAMRRDTALEASGFTLNTGYVPYAEYTSKEIRDLKTYKSVRVTADTYVPPETSLTYQVSLNGSDYFTVELDKWIKVSLLNNESTPSSNKFYFKVLLKTTNPEKTPIIYNLKLKANNPPKQPTLPEYGSCFLTTTPELTWTFSDPDEGDKQGAYWVQIARASDLKIAIDSGIVICGDSKYTVPTSGLPEKPGSLWNTGEYQYKYRVKVWDDQWEPWEQWDWSEENDFSSKWSNWGDFCVIAFERPRIAQIISPPSGQEAPDPEVPATHILIEPEMPQEQLPRVKAGAKVVLLADSIGPLETLSPMFPYLNLTATTNIPDKTPTGTNNPMYPAGNAVNRWAIEFWTDPSLKVCPLGTLVTMKLDGDGNAGAASLYAPPYAAGVVVTQGSIYEDWFVVLQGRND